MDGYMIGRIIGAMQKGHEGRQWVKDASGKWVVAGSGGGGASNRPAAARPEERVTARRSPAASRQPDEMSILPVTDDQEYYELMRGLRDELAMEQRGFERERQIADYQAQLQQLRMRRAMGGGDPMDPMALNGPGVGMGASMDMEGIFRSALPFAATINAGVTVQITQTPQQPFRGLRLIVTGGTACRIDDIQVARQTQLPVAGSLEAASFSADAIGTELATKWCPANQNFTLTVTNPTGGALSFAANYFGTWAAGRYLTAQPGGM
jgi:hypothetical protein